MAFVSAGGTTANFDASNTPITMAADAGSSADRVLVVTVFLRNTQNHTITATYNGVSLTPYESINEFIDALTFYLYNPASGSNTLSINTTGGTGSATAVVAWEVLDGVDTGTPPRATTGSYNGSFGAAGTTSISVNSDTGEQVLAMHMVRDVTAAPSGTATGFTERHEQQGGSVFGLVIGDAAGASPSVATSVLWNNDGSDTAIVQGMSFAPASAADTLTIDSQPSTGTSGVALANIVVSSSDTGSTETVTATIDSGGGSLSGTTSGAMTAGEITFSNLIITGTGVHTLAFNATGHDEVVSSNITISGSGPSGFRSYYIRG